MKKFYKFPVSVALASVLFFVQTKTTYAADSLSGIFFGVNDLSNPEQIKTIFFSLSALFSVCATIMIIVGGIMYFFSGGDQSRANKGKALIIGSLTGVVVWVSAFIIINIIS